MKRIAILSIVLCMTAPLVATAASHSPAPHDMGGMKHDNMGNMKSGDVGKMDHGAMNDKKSATNAAAMIDGEVKKVDKEAGKITLKHGPLTSLDMPAMTMVFKVKDPAILTDVKQGDKVSFVAEKLNGAFTVTKMEAAK